MKATATLCWTLTFCGAAGGDIGAVGSDTQQWVAPHCHCSYLLGGEQVPRAEIEATIDHWKQHDPARIRLVRVLEDLPAFPTPFCHRAKLRFITRHLGKAVDSLDRLAGSGKSP